MDFGPATFALGYLAGILSTLSPCVLPLLPVLAASALAEHRHGLWALAGGLALSFTIVGLFVASTGAAIGLDSELLRRIGGLLLAAFGAVLLVPQLQDRFAAAVGGLASGGNRLLAGVSGRGWSGQALVGVLLGVVWSPCVGPTLGAASTYAAQGRHLPAVAALMLLFGLGAATPLVVVGFTGRHLTARSREAWLRGSQRLRRLLGGLLVGIGLAIASGLDKVFEAWLVDMSPAWLTELTTRL